MLSIVVAVVAQTAAPAAPTAPLIEVGEIRASEQLDGDVRGVVTGALRAGAHCFAPDPASLAVTLFIAQTGGVPIDVDVTQIGGRWPLPDEQRCFKADLVASDIPLFAAKPYALTALFAVGGATEAITDRKTADARDGIERARLAEILRRRDVTTDDAPRVKYDRFRDRTDVSAQIDFAPTLSFRRQDAELVAIFHGKSPTPGADARLLLSFMFAEWKYLKCHSVAMLVDGKPVALGEPKHDGEVIEGGVSEILIVPVPQATRQRMSTSSKIELQICNDEVHVDGDLSMRRIKNFVTLIDGR